MFRAFSSHQQPSAYLTKGIPQLDKPLGQTGQNLAYVLQFFTCLFCARFTLLQTGLSNREY